MATVTGYTAARMQQIEDSSIVDGVVVGNNLVLTRRDSGTITTGNVRGPQGIQGPMGVTSISVCTSTTRPTGGSLFTGLAIYETDTKRFYIYDGSTWNYRSGVVICTAATRPSAPITGMGIYETDTHQDLVYNGIRFNKPWMMPWGITVYSVISGSFTTTETLMTSTPPATFTATANRRLKVTFGMGVYYFSGAASQFTIRLKKDGVTIKTASPAIAPGDDRFWFDDLVLDTPTVGSHTYTITALGTAAGPFAPDPTIHAPYILVEDIGPNGVPA